MKKVARKNISLKARAELMELEPFGISPSLDAARPIMLFRELDGQRVLPVWLSPLDAGIAMMQSHSQAKSPSPHDFTKELLEALNLELAVCTFDEVRGHHQFVTLTLKGSRRVKNLKTRADHVISLCLHAKCRFFVKPEVFKKSQEVNGEMFETANHIKVVGGHLIKNPHPYLN